MILQICDFTANWLGSPVFDNESYVTDSIPMLDK